MKVVDDAIAQITATETVLDGATTLINSFHQIVADAVQSALANGATADQLAPITDAMAVVKAKTDALAAAVVANTPTPPVPVPGPNMPTTSAKPPSSFGKLKKE